MKFMKKFEKIGQYKKSLYNTLNKFPTEKKSDFRKNVENSRKKIHVRNSSVNYSGTVLITKGG